MKLSINAIIVPAVAVTCLFACSQGQNDEQSSQEQTESPAAEENIFYLSDAQFTSLDFRVDSLRRRNLSSFVRANGQLEVPPQNKATVTSSIGANVSSIHVIEGDDVTRGKVLAYLSHPNLTQLQGDYLEAYNKLQYLTQEFERQKRLYDEQVGSGKIFQQTQADYRTADGIVKSLGLQLRQMGIDPRRIQNGDLYEKVPVVSPIDGSVVKVEVNTGQYVQPEKNLFEIVNTHHIHADLMVFEKDVHKVKVGQRVQFTVETFPDRELYAEIYSVGKKFEQDPKAVHVHADIENNTGNLIPGMYISGRILAGSEESYALPEEAIAHNKEKYFGFLARKIEDGESHRWRFEPIEVIPGNTSDGWTAVSFPRQPPADVLFAMNHGYYLSAEWTKGEAEERH